MAIACIIGESNGSCVGSATISFNPVPRLSTTPFKSKLPSVSVPVLKKKNSQNFCLNFTKEINLMIITTRIRSETMVLPLLNYVAYLVNIKVRVFRCYYVVFI